MVFKGFYEVIQLLRKYEWNVVFIQWLISRKLYILVLL